MGGVEHTGDLHAERDDRQEEDDEDADSEREKALVGQSDVAQIVDGFLVTSIHTDEVHA
jgi:hypothetical protein